MALAVNASFLPRRAIRMRDILIRAALFIDAGGERAGRPESTRRDARRVDG